jgi:hypothetical protein
MAARIITRTVYGATIQTVRALGMKHVVVEYTTINQAINEPTIINKLPTPLTRGMEIYDPYDFDKDSNNIFTQYLVVGNGGHENINNPNDAVPYSIPVPHKATDSGLFNLMPFILRKADDDLTVAERRKYALRRTVEVDGVLYAAYYARKIEFPRTTPEITITKIVDGESVVETFVPTINNLRPVKYAQETEYKGAYATVSSFVQLVWDENDIQDAKDACRIMFGNERMAIISELAICSAVEKPIKQRYPSEAGSAQTPINVPANTFFEAVACQVNVHITTYIPLSYADQEYTLSLNLGATEPLFGVESQR